MIVMKMPLSSQNLLPFAWSQGLRSILLFTGSIFVLSGTLSKAQAQIATVGVAERLVEKRAGQAGTWKETKKGTALGQGDGLRTGKRSKVDALFRDGSLVRLGQLSSLEIESGRAEATRVRLQKGRIIFVKKPGSGGTSRVLTGTGAAEIKGSVAFVEQNDDGSAEYTNYAGSVSVSGLNNGVQTQRVDLPPGYWVKTSAGGILSAIRKSAPFSSQREMISGPVNSPFAGSFYEEFARVEPGILNLDTTLNNTNTEGLGNPRTNPFVPRSPLPGGQPPFGGPFPPPNPTPTPAPIGGLLAVRESSLLSGSPTKSSFKADSLKPGALNAQETSHNWTSLLVAQVNPPVTVPPATVDPGQAAQTVGQGSDLAGLTSIDFAPTYSHLENVNRRLGSISGIEYRAVGLVGSDSVRGGVGHLRAFTKKGPLAADVIVNPQNLRFDVPGRRISRNNIVVSHATLSYEAKAASLFAGRQNFLSGPVRASFFGSMTRSGGREIMDAVRVVPNLGSKFGAEFSYLYDAFPRDLPYNVRNNQEGFLGRVYTRQRFGNFGLNVLKYTNSPVPDRTGVTLDFSVPILVNKLDFYGEVGTDPFRRDLRTFGVTIPYLYQKTNFDLYIERAKLDTSPVAAGIGSEWAVRVYRKINKSADFVGAYNRYNGGNSTLLLGVSVGGQTLSRPR
jgi:hypothetical protein